MRTITLFLFAALAVTSVEAAWYQKNDGTIVDPIQSVLGGNLAYTGNNLEPNANLDSADLTDASLESADLEGANLANADLRWANLTDADLTSADFNYAVLGSADLSGADLTGADLTGADFNDAVLRDAGLTGADLSGSILTHAYDYNDATWTDAFYYTNNEPTWDSGMDAAWRSSVGILALAPVPEPAAMLLALLGLALLPRRRRR